MPALSRRVLVQHKSGARKEVLRSELPYLSRLWKRVQDFQPRKRKTSTTVDPTTVDASNDEPAAPDKVEE